MMTDRSRALLLEKINKKRRELYKEPGLEVFFSKYLSTFKKITPQFSIINGYKYTELEKILEDYTGEIELLLEEMVEVNILEKELYDVEVHCPTCDSPNISTSYQCPFCKSIDIERNCLVDHVNCGCIETITDFNSRNICPKCNKTYEEGGYRVLGEWYQCQQCGKQLENPLVAHFCRDCDARFSFIEALTKNVYTYTLSPMAEKELNTGILFPSPVRELLISNNYEMVDPPRVKGDSGIMYEFDFLASKPGNPDDATNRMAIDISFSLEPVQESEVMQEYNKISDTKVRTFFIAMPELNDVAKKLATSYELNVIEAKNDHDAISKLKNTIHQM